MGEETDQIYGGAFLDHDYDEHLSQEYQETIELQVGLNLGGLHCLYAFLKEGEHVIDLLGVGERVLLSQLLIGQTPDAGELFLGQLELV